MKAAAGILFRLYGTGWRGRMLPVLAVLAVVCLLTPVLAQDSPEEEDARASAVLSDTTGEIEQVVLQYSSSLAAEVLPTYRSLLGQLSPATVVHVVCETDTQVEVFRQILAEWQVEKRERFKLVSAGKEITVWARDRFVVKAAKDNRRRKLVVLPSLPDSDSADRQNDKEVPALIAKSTGEEIETKESSLFFEGGNVVTSDKFLFTGHSTLIDPKIPSDEEAIRLLEREFGKKVVVIGSDKVREPEEHIDMYLTPIDDKTVLLGDPALARSILAQNEDGQREDKGPEDDSGENPGGTTVSKEVLQSYANAKKQLEKAGFKVQRVPILLDDCGYTVTYNNVLMEVREGKRIVYMPVYGVNELDSAATKKYKSLGFEVRPVDVSKIYRFGGTVRCVTNVLARSAGEKPGREGEDEHRDSLQSQGQLQKLP